MTTNYRYLKEGEVTPMDINTLSGSKIVFQFPTNGYPHHQKAAKDAGLEVGSEYTLKSADIHECYTYIELVEIEGKFNSVLFANVPFPAEPTKDETATPLTDQFERDYYLATGELGRISKADCQFLERENARLKSRNAELVKALKRLNAAAEPHVADQSRAEDERCGLTQPISVREGQELYDAWKASTAALSSEESEGK